MWMNRESGLNQFKKIDGLRLEDIGGIGMLTEVIRLLIGNILMETGTILTRQAGW